MSSLTQDFLRRIDRIDAALLRPRVRAVHLPPNPQPDSLRGEFCAVELDDGSVGLSYVLLDDTLQQLRALDPNLDLAGRPAREAAALYAHADAHRRTLGFAAINALTASLYARAGWLPPTSCDSSGAIDPGPADHVGMIGLFSPLVAPIVSAGARLTVIELREDLVGTRDGWSVTLDRGALADCNKIVSTGTLLLNDTLDPMLAQCRRAQEIALIGPTMGCLPDPLFDRGITFIGGAMVEQPQAYLQALRSGRSRSGMSRKTGIRRSDYPGLQALLQAL